MTTAPHSRGGRPPRPQGPKITRSFRFDRELIARAQHWAELRGEQLTPIVTRALEDYVRACDVAAIVSRLNEWEETFPSPTEGRDVWEELIRGLPEYDPEATDRLPGVDANDRFALRDGTLIRYDRSRRRWYAVAED